MSKGITHRRRVRDEYLDLIRTFPLRAIRDDAELDEAIAVLTRLMTRDENSLAPGEDDYLSALAVLVRDYEAQRFAARRGSAQTRLKHVLDESGTTSARLRQILGCSQPLVSLILAGKRELQKDHIRKLADHFKVRADYFL